MIDFLEKKQQNFEGSYKYPVEAEKSRQAFVKRFDEPGIKRMKIDEYIAGKDKKDSFCNWIERKLRPLGGIGGGYANKFSLYYSAKRKKYEFVEKFRGLNDDETFQNIKKAILDLLDAGKKRDIDRICQNELAPMFKGKILSTYYPEYYVPVFSKDDLNYFLKRLGQKSYERMDEVRKREYLAEFKENDPVMSNWSMHKFSDFLYKELFGQSKNLKNKGIDISRYFLPDIKKQKTSFISLNMGSAKIPSVPISPIKGKKKQVNYEEEEIKNRRFGERGEILVLNAERNYLINAKKKDLAKRVEKVSEKDDSLGYDILSYTKSGNKKHIEVKSTINSDYRNVRFLITANELAMAKKLKNYYIYIVFKVNSLNPQICCLSAEELFGLSGRRKIIIEPIKYHINLSLYE